MESNSDRQLRDKLKNLEYPFDPKAWEGMEEMLDKRKGRKGVFWWWTAGIAAALLFGMIGYELHEIVDIRQSAKNRSRQLPVGSEAENKGERLEVGSGPTRENVNGALAPIIVGSNKQQYTAGTEPVNEGQSGKKEESLSENLDHSPNSAVLPPKIIKKAFTKNKTDKTAKPGILSGGVMVNMGKRNGLHKTNGAQNGTETVLNKSKHEKKEGDKISNRKEDNTTKESERKKPESTTFAPFRNEVSISEFILAALPADELIGKAQITIAEPEKIVEDALPKKKKRIFHYSLGVLANVSGTSLGSQTYSGIQNKRAPLFYGKPSYMAGLTQDFLFINRIAISNSILFSQTSFEVYKPVTVSFSKSPSEYTSRITELDIPIGIKVYPVVKKNFSFYIHTGIINHIKLKETFDYTLPADTVYNYSAITGLADNAVFPMQTNFTRDNTGTVNQQGYSNSTKDFSINSAKRYYLSFYASAGFEYLAKKHFTLFTEPMFYMSLQKIGVQDKRKYNVGISGGMRYLF